MRYLYKIGFWIILIINLIFGGILLYQKSMLKDFLISSYTEKSEMVDSVYVEQDGEVLIKNIERVAKLTLVEHNFVEVFTYSDYQTWDHPFFRKKMIVKSNARVGIGLDVSKLQLESNQLNKQILIKSIPVPEVLFMEDDITYFDTEEGWFNQFDEEDYTEIHQETKNKVLDLLYQSPIFEEVEYEFIDHLVVIANLAKNIGWTLVVEDKQWANDILYQIKN